MSFTKEQERTAYKRLPPEIQDLVMSGETSEIVEEALKDLNLSEEQGILADSEIFYSLLCLQSLDTALKNISSVTKKSSQELTHLALEVKEKLLSKFEEVNLDINDLIKANSTPIGTSPVTPISSHTSPPPSNLPVVEEHEPVPMVVNKPVINKPIINKPIIDKVEPVEALVREVSTYQATINKLFTRPATPGMTGMANSTPPTKNLNLIDSIPKPSVPVTPPPPVTPTPTPTSAPKAPTPEEPKLYPGGKDPYREPLE